MRTTMISATHPTRSAALAHDTHPAAGSPLAIGQRVSIRSERVQTPEQLGVVYTVAQVALQAGAHVASLQAPDGTIAKWFRTDELEPAAAGALSRATTAATPQPAATSVIGKMHKHQKLDVRRSTSIGKPAVGVAADDVAAQAVQRLMALASLVQKQRGVSFRDALIIVSSPDPDAAEAALAHSPSESDGDVAVESAQPSFPVTQHGEGAAAVASATLLSLATGIADTEGITLRAALAAASRRHPAAVKTYCNHFGIR